MKLMAFLKLEILSCAYSENRITSLGHMIRNPGRIVFHLCLYGVSLVLALCLNILIKC